MTSEAPPGHARRQLSLFDAAAAPTAAPDVPPRAGMDADAEARAHAVDPRHHVVLEASAGTGKTSVLVARYVNLLKAGVDPGNILAITFTRKAAAEMRERIVRELRRAAAQSELDRTLWSALRDRLSDVAISTIDAFCLSLLREFPLEADVDPGFDLADETEVPRLTATALDRTMRILAGMARHDEDVALVLAQLGIARSRQGLATLLERRLVAREVLDRFLARGPRGLTAEGVCRAAAQGLEETLASVPGGLRAFAADGPGGHPRYDLFLRELERLPRGGEAPAAAIRAALERIGAHFLTADGRARRPGSTIPPYRAEHYPSRDAAKRHRELVFQLAPRVEQVVFAFRRDLNAVLARGVRRMFAVALVQYREALEERSVLDFPDVLQRAVDLLRRMDEFSQSRFRLESRYHHVLVDELQDTSRAQWELVSLLVQAWGEGLGVAMNPSIFVVGDRKQSIYRFRDAEVEVLEHAARYIDGLRPSAGARRAITRSFRAVPELLHLVNDLFSEMSQPEGRPDQFTYGERDRFPVDDGAAAVPAGTEPALGVAVAETPEECAAAVADEIVRLLDAGTVRDPGTGVARPVVAGDIAILFRSRTSHREFERELGRRGVPTHVYKGLGFFDADEVKDIVALLRFLADPASALRAAALLRSRLVRVSDPGIEILAPVLPAAVLGGHVDQLERLDPEDRQVVDRVRRDLPRWLGLVDRTTPAELLDRILGESAYFYELRGVRRRQAWENAKKLRGLIRRMQNRGYPTLRRIAEYLMSMTAGDESNAVVEALDAVNLMTVHASKGLEFPIVFVVNMAKGASGPPQPIRVVAGGGLTHEDDAAAEASVTVGPFLSEADEIERERERHETRRLLYVALTRARDRLYLSTALKEGQLAAGRGSLAEVLPPSFAAFFGHAFGTLPGTDVLGWTGASGRAYTWRLCRADAARGGGPDTAGPRAGLAGDAAVEDDFGPPAATVPTLIRVSASQTAAQEQQDQVEPDVRGDAPSDRLFGVLVHRLFEHGEADDIDADEGNVATAAFARRLLRPEEAASVPAPDSLGARAGAGWMAARVRPDIAEALRGERRYEVPFSLLLPGESGHAVVRGVIDCVVRNGPAFTVVEFKTGRRQAAHERQLELYTRAIRALYPAAPVTGALIYL